MPIDITKLGAFAQINNATGRGVVQLAANSEAQLKQAGTYAGIRLIGRAIRSVANENRNNATRESFLQALGAALGIEGAVNGKFVLDEAFLDKIAQGLGFKSSTVKDAKKLLGTSDFQFKNGLVISGRPLTERRITQIVNRVYEQAKLERANTKDVSIGSIGKTFADALQKQVSSIKISGWDAANATDHRKMLSGLLAEMIAPKKHAPFNQFLLGEKDQLLNGKENLIVNIFNRLCSRFSANKSGLPRFDEAGFFKDLEELNAAVLATHTNEAVRSLQLKTVNPIELLKKMNAVDPGRLYPPPQTKPNGIPVGAQPKQRGDAYIRNARIWLKASDEFQDKEKVDTMDLRGLLGCLDENRHLSDLLKAMNRTLEASGKSVVVKSGNVDVQLKAFLDGMSNERNFVLTMMKSCRMTEFGYDAMRDLLAQATNRLIVEDRRFSKGGELDYDDKIARAKMANKIALAGGGLKGEAFSYDVTYGKNSYKSNFAPAHTADFAPQKDAETDKKKLPLANLAHSSVTKDGKTLVSFTRFGQVALVATNRPHDGIRDQYDELVKQMISTNANLQKRIEQGDGKAKVPIYRIDLTGVGESYMNESADHIFGLNRPVVDANYTVDVKIGKATKTVRPEFKHLMIPIDAPKKSGEACFTEVMDNNLPILRDILNNAENALENKLLHGVDAVKADKLVRSIKAYCDRYKEARQEGGSGLTFREFCSANGGDACAAFGVQMMRLGSQTGVLLSLLGDDPAVNCNWGRDRTSAMDAMIKQVAIQLDAGEEPTRIHDAGILLQAKKLNTKMLFDTGNTDVARMTNVMPHNIALNQSRFTGRPKTTSQSGLVGLYDYKGMGETKSYENNSTFQVAKDAISAQMKEVVDLVKNSQNNTDEKKNIITALRTLGNDIGEIIKDYLGNLGNSDENNDDITDLSNKLTAKIDTFEKEHSIEFNSAKTNLTTILLREVLRARLMSKEEAVLPANDPQGVDANQLRLIHRLAEKIADAELRGYENMGTEELKAFASAYGSLNRQRIENVVFENLCKDTALLKLISQSIQDSTGKAEYDPNTSPYELLSADSFPNTNPSVEKDDEVATRAMKSIIHQHKLDCIRLLTNSKLDHKAPTLSTNLLRDSNIISVPSTVTLIDPDGKRHSLADKPERLLQDNDSSLQIQGYETKKSPIGHLAATNLVNYLQNNIQGLAKNTYNGIMMLVSSVLGGGATSLAGELGGGYNANYGLGGRFDLGNFRLHFSGYGDYQDREITMRIQQGQDNKHLLVIKQKQKLDLQFEGYQIGQAKVNFSVPKGYIDSVLTIPLEQELPGETELKSGNEELKIRNPPKFTLEVNVVQNKDEGDAS